jgi:branched-chain amino acid transport system permease protein
LIEQTIIEIIIHGLILGGLYCLMSIGFSLISGVARVMNLAHGAFYMLTAYLIYSMLSIGLGPAIIISLITTVIVSLVIYQLLIGPLREKGNRAAIVTLALALIFQESMKLIYGPEIKSTPNILTGVTLILGYRVTYQKLLVVIVSVILVLILLIFIKYTKQGKAIRAVAQNMEVARLVGINIKRTFMLSMGISALLAGLAAALFASLNYVSPISWTILFSSFPVIVLGGLGSIKGSFIAAFIIAFIEKTIEFTVVGAGYLVPTVTFAIMLLVLLIKPTGLFGKPIEDRM